MKFAKELEQELVPEWRIKYLNYKAGKKYVKAVTRAINRASTSPNLRRSGDLPPRRSSGIFAPGSPFASTRIAPNNRGEDIDETASLRASPAPLGQSKATPRHQQQQQQQQQSWQLSGSTRIRPGERQSLTETPRDNLHYGSIISSSHARSPSVATDSSRLFELPAPALRVASHVSENGPAEPSSVATGTMIAKPASSWINKSQPRRASMAPAASQQAGTFTSSRSSTFGLPYELNPRQHLRRIFSVGSPIAWDQDNNDDINMRVLDEVREREQEFFRFLDSELDKVETFYKLKEEQAGERLQLLREQLHEMRNRRILEIQAARRRGRVTAGKRKNDDIREESPGGGVNGSFAQGYDGENSPAWSQKGWVAPIRAKLFRPGPNSKALQKMPQTPHMLSAGARDERRDYIRRGDNDIPYRTAKHKLKLALQEFYRGLELLKSYAMLNRTAFRKLNKKYDKAVNARPPYRYINEKVNQSWFVNSSVVDDLIVAVEDLYARYFERGNHKIAAGKLRALIKRPGDESGSAFRNGLLIGVGAVFVIEGVVSGSKLLFHDDAVVRQQASYLLQFYGGYFLMLYLFSLFCISCHIWTINKINYPFIFEFDPRSHLDWRQLSQFPSFFLLVFGLFMWLNFSGYGSPDLYLYYPVIMIAFSAVLLFLPVPTLWHRSRKWFLYSHWRLFFAGLYPVEFRDFFLGDMYCSLTYAICNVELFFCVYAHKWNDPLQCNSSKSRLLGFFSALPPIWRALQCIRRYRDTKNVFPHLVNCGKYIMTILSYMCLSLYRIQGTHTNLALFITFSTVNSMYTSIWDLFMDFSLLQTDSRQYMLRDILALKRRWVYYVIMVLDPILRFSWIFYAIFTYDTQHSTIVSFMVSLAEATRRGMWALLRVENEHCANVAQYKASRDIPLPYHLHAESKGAGQKTDIDGVPMEGGVTLATGNSRISGQWTQYPAESASMPAGGVEEAWTGTDAAEEEGAAGRPTVSGGVTPVVSTLRHRRTDTGKRTIANIMAEAHKQDFEKRRPSQAAASTTGRQHMEELSSDEAGEDEDEDEMDGEDGMMDDDDDERSIINHDGSSQGATSGHKDI